MGLIATMLDSEDIEYFRHYRKFYWIALKMTFNIMGLDKITEALVRGGKGTKTEPFI